MSTDALDVPSRPRFDVAGPLPSGVAVLEASAGTGKTYALSALAVRFVAERGVAASQLCIVSFTEAATAELRGRVRSRLVDAVAHLEAGAPTDPDPVLTAIAATADPGERALRLSRLRAAVAEFDAATVATIHGFCRRVLSGASVGMADVDLSGDLDDVDEVVHDVVLARVGHDVPDSSFVTRMRSAVRTRLTMPDAQVWVGDEPQGAVTGDEAVVRSGVQRAADIIDEICTEVGRRRALARRRSFDDLIADTRAALSGSGGLALVAALRDRYRVVLIDEFQDTDSVQWDLFRTAFVGGADAATVVLVGDPKQAIYRFRSAELSAYLAAVHDAQQVSTLGTNWRSDRPLLGALGRVFDGFTFGAPEIGFVPVDHAPGHEHPALHGVPAAPLQLRTVPLRDDGKLTAGEARLAVQRDVVAVVAGLLDGSVEVQRADDRKAALSARDVAVLTRSNADASALALRLGAAGIPAATSSSNSVLSSDAAAQWRLLLAALERPGSAPTARAAALGWFLGHEPAEVAAFDDDGLAELHDRLRTWAEVLAQRGIPTLLALAREQGLHRRLLARRGGERDLTDLDHVAELLQTGTGGRPVGAASLLAVLTEVADDEDDAIASDNLARRIDRDDDAVQVLTVHKAKGLEFPVVLCPFLWTQPGNVRSVPHAYLSGRRCLDAAWVADKELGKSGKPPWASTVRAGHVLECAGEDRRLLYVALTRARHRLVVWWAPVTTGGRGPLRELLEHAAGGVSPADLQGFGSSSDGTIEVVPVSANREPATLHRPADPQLAVATASFVADRAWRRWSFSGIKAAAPHPDTPGGDTPEPEAPVTGGADEPDPTEPLPPAAEAPESVPTLGVASPLADVPGGTELGTLVHAVLERCDFASGTLDADLRASCADALRHRRLGVDPGRLAAGLVAAIDAPLGGPLGALRLRHLQRPDRLDELVFDLPLGRFRAADIGAVLAAHLPDDDPLRPWAVAAAAPRPGPGLALAGTLNGSIDLVARTDGRFWVADYKTNQLGPASSYTRAEMAAAMIHHDYPLQATLYMVALHRFLRWRLPGYDPATHIAGAAYLFVRGMDPSRPVDDTRGVFWWRPPVSALLAVDELLAVGALA